MQRSSGSVRCLKFMYCRHSVRPICKCMYIRFVGKSLHAVRIIRMGDSLCQLISVVLGRAKCEIAPINLKQKATYRTDLTYKLTCGKRLYWTRESRSTMFGRSAKDTIGRRISIQMTKYTAVGEKLNWSIVQLSGDTSDTTIRLPFCTGAAFRPARSSIGALHNLIFLLHLPWTRARILIPTIGHAWIKLVMATTLALVLGSSVKLAAMGL